MNKMDNIYIINKTDHYLPTLDKTFYYLVIDQTAQCGHFRRDLGCGKAVKSHGRGAQKLSMGGQRAVIAQNYKQMAILAANQGSQGYSKSLHNAT